MGDTLKEEEDITDGGEHSMNEEKNEMDELRAVLKKLLRSNPEITFAIITSIEGLPILSILPDDFNEFILSATVATMLSLSERAVREMKIEEFKDLLIRGNKGNIFVCNAELAVLSVSTTKFAKIGMIFHECERAARNIADILKKSS
ncbi:MAG: roadblock/LC7 domain-containing protein [Promethearchaeota archaeon]|jgi:predicted regulator of Ras-like GTPase activity (Roadblock/LC7/MglB family)